MASSTLVKDVQGGYWRLETSPYKITNTDKVTFTFDTENKFVDADMVIEVKADAASSLSLALTDLTSTLTMGTASSGVYSPTVSLTGTMTAGTAGWFTSGTATDSSVAIGKINQSIMKNGTTIISNNTTIIPTSSQQTITITEGYNTARTIIIDSTSSATPAVVTSGSASITSLTYAYDSSSSKFNITGSADVSAPTVGTAGYISSGASGLTVNTGGATVSTTVNKISLNSTLSGATTARKPTLSKQAISITGVTDAASGSATATAPSSGVYVAVRSAANTATINSAPVVHADGYGTTTNYAVNSAASATVGAAQSDIYYVPITTTSATVDGKTVSYGSGWITAGSSSVAVGTITSGSGTATISTPTYDSTATKFVQSASGTIAAPTVNTAGYVSTTEGTKNTSSISGSKELDVVTVGGTVSGTAKVTPVIARTAKPSGDSWFDGADGAVTTTKPTSSTKKAYIRLDAAAKTSTLTINGEVTGEGYGTTSHFNTATAISQEIGSNAATATYAPIKSGSFTYGSSGGSLTDSSLSYNSSTSKFTASDTHTVSLTQTTAGYIDKTNNIGTLATNAGSTTITLNKIGIQANLSGTGTKKPSITKHNNTNVDASAATTTQPSSGYYVAVSSAANTGTVTATATVTSAGYGDTTSGHYTTTNSDALTIGASASDTTYVPLAAATLNNTATSGVTYTDISSTGPILISGSYLFIDGGYIAPTKISLARLVPDASGDNAPASYILEGYTAFDNNGALIVGTMQTYAGAYTIT